MTVLNEPAPAWLRAESPMAMFDAPLVLLDRAKAPMAWLNRPSRLAARAEAPTALFEEPSRFEDSASAPTAVLKFAVPAPDESLFCSARSPTAVLSAPTTLANNA